MKDAGESCAVVSLSVTRGFLLHPLFQESGAYEGLEGFQGACRTFQGLEQVVGYVAGVVKDAGMPCAVVTLHVFQRHPLFQEVGPYGRGVVRTVGFVGLFIAWNVL